MFNYASIALRGKYFASFSSHFFSYFKNEKKINCKVNFLSVVRDGTCRDLREGSKRGVR